MNGELAIFNKAPSRLPDGARVSKFPGDLNSLYQTLVSRGLEEFPPIEGYETMHCLLVERLAYFFCAQKAAENLPIIVDTKKYRTDIGAFLRTADSMLKEARAISAETTFKHNFIRQVVEVIDRTVPSEHKPLVIRELEKLAY